VHPPHKAVMRKLKLKVPTLSADTLYFDYNYIVDNK
jgi:hypothetical protein